MTVFTGAFSVLECWRVSSSKLLLQDYNLIAFGFLKMKEMVMNFTYLFLFSCYIPSLTTESIFLIIISKY